MSNFELSSLQLPEELPLSLPSQLVARANRYTDTVGLFQAPGGGWWNRKDFAEK